jgi:hypothetical protein
MLHHEAVLGLPSDVLPGEDGTRRSVCKHRREATAFNSSSLARTKWRGRIGFFVSQSFLSLLSRKRDLRNVGTNPSCLPCSTHVHEGLAGWDLATRNEVHSHS